MANHVTKAGSSKLASSQTLAASTTAPASPTTKANSASKPNSLLGSSLAPVTAEIRRAMIAEAAYYIAEQRGFGSGRDVEDWLLAEKQIDTVCST